MNDKIIAALYGNIVVKTPSVYRHKKKISAHSLGNSTDISRIDSGSIRPCPVH